MSEIGWGYRKHANYNGYNLRVLTNLSKLLYNDVFHVKIKVIDCTLATVGQVFFIQFSALLLYLFTNLIIHVNI